MDATGEPVGLWLWDYEEKELYPEVRWVPKKARVKFPGDNGEADITYGSDYPPIGVPDPEPGMVFEGYYYGDEQIYDEEGKPTGNGKWRWDIPDGEEIKLEARWTPKKYSIFFGPDHDGDGIGDLFITVTYGQPYPSINPPVYDDGELFDGFYCNGELVWDCEGNPAGGVWKWDPEEYPLESRTHVPAPEPKEPEADPDRDKEADKDPDSNKNDESTDSGSPDNEKDTDKRSGSPDNEKDTDKHSDSPDSDRDSDKRTEPDKDKDTDPDRDKTPDPRPEPSPDKDRVEEPEKDGDDEAVKDTEDEDKAKKKEKKKQKSNDSSKDTDVKNQDNDKTSDDSNTVDNNNTDNTNNNKATPSDDDAVSKNAAIPEGDDEGDGPTKKDKNRTKRKEISKTDISTDMQRYREEMSEFMLKNKDDTVPVSTVYSAVMKKGEDMEALKKALEEKAGVTAAEKNAKAAGGAVWKEKAVKIAKAGAVTAGSAAGLAAVYAGLVYLFGMAEIYSICPDGRKKRLGKLAINEEGDGFMVNISRSILNECETNRLGMRLSALFVSRNRNREMIINNDGRKTQEYIRRDIVVTV
ncbi:MAG: hypothetical protein K5686_12825 [Lachnospiraceae bacterium]|nr:hypothetical protein [Lachnospiraceae bacterium]